MPEGNQKAFGLLHPSIQRKLYDMKWTELRPIQVDTIREIILAKSSRIVISAQTASGKTEAAFLPILSEIANECSGGVRALYIGPLKALINDQFRRLEDLCQRASIPVWRWHGDVGQSSKRALIKTPSGVLLITPESLESLFINRPQHIDKLFRRLSFVVIDEMHSFMGTERGAHLKSLIHRLAPRSKEKLSVIGLSATLGDMKHACDWVRLNQTEGAFLIEDETEEKTIRYMVHGYLREPSRGKEASDEENCEGCGPEATAADEAMASDIYEAFKNKTALIFANSKSKLEFFADRVRRISQRKGLLSPFRVHHGSLGKGVREDAEDDLRSNRPTSVFCSSTLEMGIDVGNVSIIGQIGPPWSVSSLIQRLGRSGRGPEQPSIMRVFIDEYESGNSTPIIRRLYPSLLQAIAMSELMLQKWCEPPDLDRIHASTLIHQIMSVIAETGGVKTDRLHQKLIKNGVFKNVSKDMFIRVLRCLGDKDVIEQMSEGDLILGIEGERVVRRFDFYAAFRVDDEVRVMHKSKCIGSVLLYPSLAADGFIILAGRRWKILEVDRKRREILVTPSKGGRLPFFSGSHGPDVHPAVRQKMREVLFSDKSIPYLDPKASELLEYARAVADDSKLSEACFSKDESTITWFTWTGSRINRTLMALGHFYGDMHISDEGIALNFERTSAERICEAYRGFLESCPTAVELAASFPCLQQEKFEHYLSDALLAEVFADSNLDIDGAKRIIEHLE
ncbi:DEAD/DEAH box helicase [bacterium]|nr:DEAD/DEAH box helicase [bacterium]